MNIFGLTSVLTVASNLGIATFLFLKGRKKTLNVLLGFVALTLSVWALGCSVFSNIPKQKYALALFWHQVGYSGTIFIPVFYSHLVYRFLNLNRKILLFFTYSAGIVFLFFNWFNNSYFFSGELKFTFNQFYWFYWFNTNNVIWLTFYILFYWLVLGYAFFLLLKYYRRSTGISRNQLKYLILGSTMGWIGGELQFLPNFGIDNYFALILGALFTTIYPLIITYGIVKHRLMDITLAITRTGIFIAVYSLVLGIPFALAFGWKDPLIEVIGDGWWMVPLVSSTVLATVGPFIYLYIQRRAEEKLFQEQHRYQTTLRQASVGMGRIKDLNRLVNLIVHIVTRTVRLEHSLIFLDDHSQKKFHLKAMRSRHVRFHPKNEVISFDSMLVKHLKETRNPILYEEIKQRTQDYGDLHLARLEKELKDLDAAVVVPSFVDDRLLAIIILGDKTSQELYSADDLNVFSILANQAALAIENAQFYEDMTRTHEQLFKAEKMATLGVMADGLSHQINNRLHALGFIAGDVLDTIKMKKNIDLSQDAKDLMVDIEYALHRIEDNVSQGGEIVRGLLKYTRQGDEGFSEVDLNHLIEAAVEMTQFKIKAGEMMVSREYAADLPLIKGNFTQLQEVFFNLIDNAYDAMMERKAEFKEPGYKAVIRITAEKEDGPWLNVYLKDNGIGVKEEDKEKLFTPFFTTKLSSKKGTGLGLYVIQKLIEENHGGRASYQSVYKEGTTVHLRLPVYYNNK